MLPDKYFIENLKNYIQQINILKKNNDTCIIILNFNNKEYILKLATYLENINADVLIVDNHSIDGSYEALLEKYSDKFNLIKTTENLGGAGGFGLGIQWVIEQGYKYCFVSEEDALPLKGNEDIFQEMIKYKDENRFVVAKYYELNTNSFNLHYFIYPVWILKEVGTLNKDLFFRADDQEWGMRIRTFLKKKNIQIETKVVDRYYSHPLIKKGFGLFANYFGMRNAFFVYLKYPNKNFTIDYFVNFIKYCSYGIFTYMNENSRVPIMQFYYAFKDFIFNDLSKNKNRIEQFKSYTLEPECYDMKELDFEKFYKKFKNYKIITSTFSNKHFQNYKFNFSNNDDVITSKYNGVARIKSFWYKNIIFVEEIDFINKKISFFKYENKYLLKSRMNILFSIFFSSFLGVVFFPIILYKRFVNK